MDFFSQASRRGTWLCLGALTALAGMACAGRSDTVKIPRHDATPPQAALDVVGQGHSWILMTGDDPMTLHMGPDDSLILIGLGEDRDGGVKDLSLAGNTVATCRDGATGAQHVRLGAFLRRSVVPGFPGLRVVNVRSARIIVRVSDFHKLCPGEELLGITGAAGVRTVNFNGASTMSPSLQFRFAEPAAAAEERAARKGHAANRSADRRRAQAPRPQVVPKPQTSAAAQKTRVSPV